MKNLLILSLFISSQLSWGKTPESELQKLKPDVDEDYVIIYEELRAVDPEIKKKNYDTHFLRTTFSIFDNVELKGEPVYVVTPDTIKFGKEHYKISDSFIGACDPVCDKYKFIPIDFMRIYFKSLALAFKEYKDGIARVEHKNKSYFFKFKLDDTYKKYEWRTYNKRETFKKILEADPSYLVFSEELKKCIKRKDVKCLEPFLDNTKLDIEKLVLNAKKRAVYDDKRLCKKFEKIRISSDNVGVDDVPDELIQEIKNIDFIWEKLENVLNFSHKDHYYSLEIANFGTLEYVRVFKGLKEGQDCCGQDFDLNLELYKNKDNIWKITSFDLYSFVY